jgi:FkbM family methyltransferase
MMFELAVQRRRNWPLEPRSEAWELLAFTMQHAPRSQSQLFQDLWVLWRTGEKRGGYFVEFGAANGKHLSNTFLLEQKYEWAGILAEPNPRFHDSIRANRNCHVSPLCVFATSGATARFHCDALGELSTLSDFTAADSHQRKLIQEIEVETISLNDLLLRFDAPRDIDYISIDTEGSEYDIIANFDFRKHRVRHFTIEHNGTAAREKIHTLMTENGYRREFEDLSFFDDWYRFCD